MKKRIFKQKGGILSMLLPFAAKVTAPLAGSLLSGIAGKLFFKKMVFKKSILISNEEEKKSSPPPIKKPKLQEEQKQKLPTIPKHSVRYALNERAKECRTKSNLMKIAKILKGIQTDCKAQPHHALLGYPFHNMTAHIDAMPTREGI